MIAVLRDPAAAPLETVPFFLDAEADPPNARRLSQGRRDAGRAAEPPPRICPDLVWAGADADRGVRRLRESVVYGRRARQCIEIHWIFSPLSVYQHISGPVRTPALLRPRARPRVQQTPIQEGESPLPCAMFHTRGEAPELSFEDALLAGLARDGGLYVPKTWPQLAPEAIAAFAGRPFAEVAVALLEPFAGGSIPRGELIAIARDAYARFGHPAVTPLVQIDRSLWVLELFHGPTLAFKDVAMQLLARLMDRVLAARGERVDHRGGDLGRHRRRGDRGLPRLAARRRRRAVPAGPHLRRAAAHDDDGNRGQRARRRRRGHLRRLPGAGEGDVRRPAPSATACSSLPSTPSTGAASSPSSPTTSPPPRRSAARSARRRSRCRPATSATSSPATRPRPWACRPSGW